MLLLAEEGLPAFGVVLASVVAGTLDWDQVWSQVYFSH